MILGDGVDGVNPTAIDAVLSFWFGTAHLGIELYQQRRKLWFGKNPAVDQEIRDRFLDLYQQATEGKLDQWQRSPLGALALVILLDQFPRNMFRNTPQAFATDARARTVAKEAIEQGWDQDLPAVQRFFFYLPLEHSEHLPDQQQCLQHYQRLIAANPELADMLDYAIRHHEIIDRFGRFPHRNRILGRDSTPEELEFLKQPGSSF